MKIVIQRVKKGSVEVDGNIVSQIGAGLVVTSKQFIDLIIVVSCRYHERRYRIRFGMDGKEISGHSTIRRQQ
jgi:hypothetical protein